MIDARLTPHGEVRWQCHCGATITFLIDHPDQVECSCRSVYVWDGRGFTVKHWTIRQHWDGDDLVTERVLD